MVGGGEKFIVGRRLLLQPPMRCTALYSIARGHAESIAKQVEEMAAAGEAPAQRNLCNPLPRATEAHRIFRAAVQPRSSNAGADSFHRLDQGQNTFMPDSKTPGGR